MLFDVLDDMMTKDGNAKDKFGEEFVEAKLGSKLHRSFMGEIGEEMCQAEVAHHANNGPEYFCSRPEKHVAFWRKALAIDTNMDTKKKAGRHNAEEDAESTDENADDEGVTAGGKQRRRRLLTNPSDLELYERRTSYNFATGTPPCEDFPMRDTPEEQVAEMNAWDYFRCVKLRGGKNPRLEWHLRECRPIVTMSPVLKMREGAQFASNARFALLQYHPWHNRMEFMGMSDAEVKTYFRSWIEKGTEQACQLPGISPRLTGEVSGAPWYIREQYSVENGKHGSTSKDPGRKRKRDAADLQSQNEEDDGGDGSGWLRTK